MKNDKFELSEAVKNQLSKKGIDASKLSDPLQRLFEYEHRSSLLVENTGEARRQILEDVFGPTSVPFED